MTTTSTQSRGSSRRGPETDPANAGPPFPRTATCRTLAVVDKVTATRRIRACADECAAPEAKSALHALARAVRRGTGTGRRATAVEAEIAEVLGAAVDGDADRWGRAEAAAWALARLVRRRRAAGSAGRLLEDLVDLARQGADVLAERDTRPARFAIVLAGLFADVEACRDSERAAVAAVAEEIGRLVTTSGAVVLSGSAAVVERACRWTSVRDAMLTLGTHGWDDDVERRWAKAAAAALRLLGGTLTTARTTPLLAALAATSRKRTQRTARGLRRGSSVGRRRRLLAPDLHDAAAATAVIRSGWERDALRVLLEYRDAMPYLEIAVGDRMLVAGPWDWRVAADGRPLEAEAAWTVAGWESQRKSAFLEITAPLAGGVRLERQVVVLRRERIVLLADAVISTDTGDAAAAELAWRSECPLAPDLCAEPAVETREVLVYDGAMRFMALPLALPEWRVAGRGGLAPDAGRLVLEQAGHRRLYAPLWLDCDPRRIGRPLTWRQLTVADTRRNLPPHQAAGYRVQCGAEQWLLYRALDAPRNRTLLGCNVSSGFLLGRVKRSGAVARTVEIE